MVSEVAAESEAHTMSRAATGQEFAVTDLLERAGARLRGRGRADCPWCKRSRSVSFDDTRGVYHCHGAGCDFSGGVAKLAQQLGLARRLSSAQYRELRQNREHGDRSARALYQRVRARRLELLERLRGLRRIELRAHDAGIDHPATWGALALVYRELPALLAELALLENTGGIELVRFSCAGPERRAQAINDVLMRGGLYNSRGDFVEFEPYSGLPTRQHPVPCQCPADERLAA
jgi:hypothetical protein